MTEKVRLRHLADVNPRTPAFDTADDNDSVTFMPLETVWADNRLDISRRRKKSEVSTGYVRFVTGDILSPKVTPTFQAGRSALIPSLGTTAGAASTEVHVVRPRREIADSRFVRYGLLTKPFLEEGVSRFQGVAGLQRVPDEFLRDLTFSAASLHEQRRIADFLDDQVARIDNIIAARQRSVALLPEGLRCHVAHELSDLRSRIGSAPLRRFAADVVTGGTPATELDDSQGTPWYTPASIQSDGFLGDPVRRVSLTAARSDGLVHFDAPSVLLVGIGATAGRVARLRWPASGNQQLTAIAPLPGLSCDFLFRQLQTFSEELLATAPFTTLPIINNDVIRRFPVVVPPYDLQSQLVVKWEIEAESIEALQAALGRSVALLSQLKRSLITAAVTGEFDVSTADGSRVPA